MAARRTIDPKIRSSRTFAKLTYRQRDLWQGIIEVGVDDQGRMPGDPAYVRSHIWPYDDISPNEVQADLNRLQEIGNIIIYTVNDDPFIQLVNWHIYQADAEWLAISSYPAPPGWIDHARYHGKKNIITTLNWDTRMERTYQPATCLLGSALPSRDVNVNDEVDVKVEGEVEHAPIDEEKPGNNPSVFEIMRSGEAIKNPGALKAIKEFEKSQGNGGFDMAFVPEMIRGHAKEFHAVTGISPGKGDKARWIKYLTEVYEMGITAEEYRRVLKEMTKAGLTIGGPESTIKNARSFSGRKVTAKTERWNT